MPSLSKKVFFADYVFQVLEEVYEPAEDSFLFVENLSVIDGSTVVDMGTGCGILGIIAAKKAAKVLVVDMNPYAVQCAKENAKMNGVSDKMLFVQGDLFAPIRMIRKFDLILFNAPYLPSEEVAESSWIGRAWAGGFSGRETIDRFIRVAPDYLARNGEILMMQSTLSNVEETLLKFEQRGLGMDVIARQDVPFFETIVLVRGKYLT
jgi:release factor glutamine methyltransferase